MSRRGFILLWLLTSVTCGCLIGKPMPSTSWMPRGWSAPGLDRPDLVAMDVFLCEGPVGERFINEEVWALADDQVLSLEHKALLEQNGLRVAQVGGVAPAGVQALLKSKKNCPDPRRIQQHAGKPTRISLGPVSSFARFQPYWEDRKLPFEFEHAEIALSVVPTATSDGRTRLRFTPEVQHGQAATLPTPTLDRTAWMFQKQQPREVVSALAWEVTVGANEHVIIGGRFDRPETLGHQAFIRSEETPPRQRILMIRCPRRPDGNADDMDRPVHRASFDGSPPLALQAALTTFRGVCP